MGLDRDVAITERDRLAAELRVAVGWRDSFEQRYIEHRDALAKAHADNAKLRGLIGRLVKELHECCYEHQYVPDRVPELLAEARGVGVE